MRIAHLADVHLGYRAYNRVTRQGINRREADVFNAFKQSLAKIVEIQPDLIVIAGDLFHVVRPSNLCIEQAFRQLMTLRSATSAPIVIIGGNHDSPRSVDTGCILDLFSAIPEVHIVHSEYQGIELPVIDTTVFCLCHRAVTNLSNLKLEPNPNTRYNVLTLHGTLEGIGANFYNAGPPITRSQIANDSWDYIALGHYHIHEKMDENIFYSGSLEYTSFNIWEETGRAKGFIEFNLDERKLVEFHKVKTRDVIDLRSIDATDMGPSDLMEIVGLRIDGIKGGHKDKIVRLVAENVDKAVLPDIDYRAIRQVRSEALHFDLSLRIAKRAIGGRVANDGGVARPLEEEWREFARAYDVPVGVDRDELATVGLEYLAGQEQ